MIVHDFEKGLAVLHGLQRHRLWQTQIRNLKSIFAGVGNRHRIHIRTKEARAEILLVLPALFPLRCQDVRGNSIARAHFLRDYRAQTREVHRGIHLMAGDRVMGALRVIRTHRVHRSHNGQLVHSLCRIRQQLGNLNARDIGGDRFECRIWLRVPSVHLARPAFQPQQNARLCLPLRGSRGGGAQELAEMNAEETEGSGLQEIAAA